MKNSYRYDPTGIKYRYPERSCELCKNYPCNEDLDELDANFAKYGCLYYK